MGKAKRQAQLQLAANAKARRSLFARMALVAILLAVVLVGVGFAFAKPKPEAPAAFAQPTTFEELVAVKPEDLPKVDTARMNLLCANGLPGAENMDLAGCLATLDRYTDVVRNQTEKYLPMYSRAPEKFRNIEGFYRMQMMVTVLKQDLGIDYSVERSNDEAAEKFFANSKDLFLNGLLAPPHTGTCASLPVLVVAVGQRLGYPVYLVSTRNHLFARWEDSTGRFNIECTNGGMTSHPDEYYTQGHFAWDGKDFSGEGFLQSMSPQQAMADFLDLRGLCLVSNKRPADARQAYALATNLKPASKVLTWKLRNAEKELAGQTVTAR